MQTFGVCECRKLDVKRPRNYFSPANTPNVRSLLTFCGRWQNLGKFSLDVGYIFSKACNFIIIIKIFTEQCAIRICFPTCIYTSFIWKNDEMKQDIHLMIRLTWNRKTVCFHFFLRVFLTVTIFSRIMARLWLLLLLVTAGSADEASDPQGLQGTTSGMYPLMP